MENIGNYCTRNCALTMLVDKEQYDWNMIGQEEQNIDDIVLSVSILYFLTKKYNIETESTIRSTSEVGKVKIY